MQKLDQYNIGFLEDDYEKSQVLVSMALKDCSKNGIRRKKLLLKEKIQENSIWLIQTEDTELQTGIFQTLNTILISNHSTQSFEELLQQFIKQQNTLIAPNNNSIESSKNMVSITNLLQHKGKERPTNKRHLSAIENQPSREKKKNKRQ
ncbi:32673_t:CDS:2, partial [Racocetra persica]